MRLRNGLAFVAQTIQMEGDRFLHVVLDLVEGAACGDTAGEIR